MTPKQTNLSQIFHAVKFLLIPVRRGHDDLSHDLFRKNFGKHAPWEAGRRVTDLADCGEYPAVFLYMTRGIGGESTSY